MIVESAKIVTGFTNDHHITQIVESLIWDGLFGSANRVLTHGSSLAIDVLPKKGVIKVLDGLFIFSKRLGVVEKSDSVTFTPMLSDSLYCKIGVAIQYTRTSQSQGQGGQESFSLVGSASPSFTSKTQAENYVVPYNGSTSYNTTITTSSTSTYKAYFPLYEVIVNASSVVSSRQLFETLAGISEIESIIYRQLGSGFMESFNLRKAERERAIASQETADLKRVTTIASERSQNDDQLENVINGFLPKTVYKSTDTGEIALCVYDSGFADTGYHEVFSIADITNTSSDGSKWLQYHPSAARNPVVTTETITWRDVLGWDHSDSFDFVRLSGSGKFLVFRHNGVLEPDQVRGVTILEPRYTYEGSPSYTTIKTKGGTS